MVHTHIHCASCITFMLITHQPQFLDSFSFVGQMLSLAGQVSWGCLSKKMGLPAQDITQVYCSLVKSVLEYAAPVWAGLPSYLSDLVESVQKEALRIIFPDLNYCQALLRAGLQTLSERHNQTCVRFIQDLSVSSFPCLASLPPERTRVNHGFGLRSGSIRQVTNINRLQRTDIFITFKYT